MSGESHPARPRDFRRWIAPAIVGVTVLAVQLWLVARAGTDIPFQDQWDAEGQGLYPQFVDGTFRISDLLRAHNEHRIVWTKLLDLALFSIDGQWNPLVQLVTGAVIHALSAVGLTWILGKNLTARGRVGVAAGVGLAFLPVLGWHNALWGFQSQVYFALLFSLLALALLGRTEISRLRQLAGLAAGIAALLSMGSGAFVPVALLGLAAVRAIERRKNARTIFQETWPALVLLVFALGLRVSVPEHVNLQARSFAQFFSTLGRVLAWPHVDQPWAAVVLNLPLLWVAGSRLARRRGATSGEDLLLLLGGWALAGALAAAWARGGSDEFAAGVPSRYADFFILLPIANVGCAAILVAGIAEPRRRAAQWIAAGWGAFLFIGWLGLSAQMLRGVILPRAQDREAPVRLIQEFQRTGNATVFAGQPRLLVPHPNLESVRTVLHDPRMSGRLPPSLQIERPLGPLSRATRRLLGLGKLRAER